MVAEAVSARDRAREEKSALALRINHLEEEKEGKHVKSSLHENSLPKVAYVNNKHVHKNYTAL